MATIDLESLTEGKVHNLSGRLRGLAARESFNLPTLDQGDEVVDVKFPPYLIAITPSFIQGMFGASVHALGNSAEEFLEKYHLHADELIIEQVKKGLSAILTRRDISDIS